MGSLLVLSLIHIWFLSENNLGIPDIDKVMFTGVGSSFIKGNLFGIPTEKVDEFLAIGQGGSLLAGTKRAIIVSMGTGTALVSVNGDKIVHLGGSGVGGGTLMGLCDKMIGVRSFEPVSYTHLDVYKRQLPGRTVSV